MYKETYGVLKPVFGHWVIFDHCLPFDVSRAYDEARNTATPASGRRSATRKCGSRWRAETMTDLSITTAQRYQTGFGNEFATEALPGALPVGQNSPQKCAYGLYAEQLSGTAFTAPRGANRRSWLYRIRPAAMHEPFERLDNGLLTNDFAAVAAPPNQLRWDPLPMPTRATDFVDGLVTMAGNGDPHAQSGCAIHVYAANRSMTNRVFYDADGELLIVPQRAGCTWPPSWA